MTRHKINFEIMRSRHDFELVMRQGNRSRGKLVTVLTSTRADGSSASRIGITVSKKVGNAVQRNLIRRRIKSIVRNVSVPENCLAVIIARPEARFAPFEDLSEEINHCFVGVDSKNNF